MTGEDLELLFFSTPLLFNKVPRNMSDSQGTMFSPVAQEERHRVQQ